MAKLTGHKPHVHRSCITSTFCISTIFAIKSRFYHLDLFWHTQKDTQEVMKVIKIVSFTLKEISSQTD